MAKQIKVSNPYPFRQGLKLMDGIREIVVHPKSFVMLDENEIYYINNMSTVFQRRKLIIHDDKVNKNLGLDFKDDISSLTDEEIKTILAEGSAAIKSKLANVKGKHVIDRIVDIAKEMDDLSKGAINALQEVSGYNFEQLLNNEQ
jgi:tmRNA-binding protein